LLSKKERRARLVSCSSSDQLAADMPAYRRRSPREEPREEPRAFDSGAPEDWPPLPPPEPNPRLRRQIARGLPSSTDDIVPLMTLIAGDSEGFERSATIERFLEILRTCSEGLDWRRSAPRRPLSRAAAAQTYYGQFVQILRCYDRDQSFGIPPFTRSAHMDPVAELFKDHPDILDRLVRLVEEFGYGGTEEPAPEAAPEEPTPEGRIDFNTAIEFVNKIKADRMHEPEPEPDRLDVDEVSALCSPVLCSAAALCARLCSLCSPVLCVLCRAGAVLCPAVLYSALLCSTLLCSLLVELCYAVPLFSHPNPRFRRADTGARARGHAGGLAAAAAARAEPAPPPTGAA
jgi:hypothetical protein